ncbi:MAG: DUF2059 domain-containing protein [Alkalilacustris sp.]
MAMLRALVLSVLMLAGAVPPLMAQRAGPLLELLRLDEILEAMRIEGLEHGEDIGDLLLAPGDRAVWTRQLERIYDLARMRAVMVDGVEASLPADDAVLEAAEAFFASELGRRVVELEVTARHAMLDEAVEEVAREAWQAKAAEGGPRVAALRRFVELGDLVEQNVAGGLNSTFAFYMGLGDSGAGFPGMGMADMLAEVRSQEGAIREEVDGWLHAYLAMAFGPLSDDELEVYTAFFAGPEGRALNAALFAGFNGMFETLSRDLGRAAGGMMQGEDL